MWIDARRFDPASVRSSVPSSKSNAARPSFPGIFAFGASQRKRPAIIRWITMKRSSSRARTIRFPTRRVAATRLPATSRVPGSTVLRTKGLPSPTLSPADVRTVSERPLEGAKRGIGEIERVPLGDVTPENILDAWDRAAIVIENAFGPVSILNSVHPDKSVRDPGDEALLAESSFMTELFQNERFYERVRAVTAETTAQKQLRKDLLEAFEDSGVTLPPEKRDRFKAISDRLTELGQEFAKNIRENTTHLTFTPAECEGLPQAWLDRVPRDEQGNVVVGFDYPDYVPFMMSSRDEEARKRYYIGNTNRGTDANIAILNEIVALRKEIADLYGVPSFAHYVTKRRMVESPETVRRFLDDVRNRVTEAELRDVAQLSEMKAAITGLPVEQAKIHRWDLNFYRERLREQRFAIDQEALRQYFPTGPSIDWMLDVSERLYGIRFERAEVPRSEEHTSELQSRQ